MKKIVLVIMVATFFVANVLHLAEAKQTNVAIKSISQLALANDEDDEVGTCTTNTEEIYVENDCDNGNTYQYGSTSFWCEDGFDTSCNSGFMRWSIDCDGTLDQTGNITQIEC